MLALNTILVPTDFSANSLSAIRQAATLARHFHSQVTLLHVDEFAVIHPFTTEAHRGQHMTGQRNRLKEFGAAELEGLPVERLVCCGDPAAVIVARARQAQTDLILMPARGAGAFRRFLLGSVTAKVLHDAPCPVWTGAHLAQPSLHQQSEIRTVLCAVDFARQTRETLDWACKFSAALGARLIVVHAVLEVPPNLPDRYTFQWHQEAREGAAQRLHEMLCDCHAHAEVQVVSDGDVPKSLSGAAKQTAADVLVIGRSAAGGEAGRPGSQTYSIICGAPCPVISV